VAALTWSRTFETPIALPDGGQLTTLREAGDYIAALSPARQRRPEWQAAAEALLLVAERGGPTMFARIGVMRALNAGKTPPAAPRRKRVKAYRLIG
jgi:hypothetical protein